MPKIIINDTINIFFLNCNQHFLQQTLTIRCSSRPTGAPTGFYPGGHRRWKGSVVGGHHGECKARTYNGGLGAEPPAESRGITPGQGVKGAKPPEAESILVIGYPTEPANLVPFQKCICISTLGATVMIWEKFMSKSRGSGDPLAPSWGRQCLLCILFLSCELN